MATQLMPHPASRRPDPAVRVLTAEQTVDVRAFARQFVAVLLDLEGVTTTPAHLAEPGAPQ